MSIAIPVTLWLNICGLSLAALALFPHCMDHARANARARGALLVQVHSSTTASRAQVMALIRKLLDESKVRDAARQAFLGERLSTGRRFHSPGQSAWGCPPPTSLPRAPDVPQ